MHEASLMRGIMKQIERVAGDENAEKIVGVKVWLGALSHMTPDHFEEHFLESSKGTKAEGAKLDMTLSEEISHPNALEVMIESVDVC